MEVLYLILLSYFCYMVVVTIGVTYGYHRYFSHKSFKDFLFQANSFDDDVFNSVRGIIDDVQKNGDQALINLCNKFSQIHWHIMII